MGKDMVALIKVRSYLLSVFTLGLLVLFLLLSSCRSNVNNSIVQKVIKDAEWFNQTSLAIDSVLSNDRVILRYYSITEEEFYEALQSTGYTVGYFTRKHDIGERIGLHSSRTGDTLRVDLKSDSLLVNTHDTYNTRYFYASQVGEYHMVKKLSFEEASTMFLSDECGTKVFEGVAAVPNEEGSLLFSSSNEQEMKWDSTQISLIKLSSCSIDTLISCNPHWFSLYSFFTDNNEIYLAHTVVNDDGTYTITPVRMEVKMK
jgi:hypothetical protein